MWQVLKSKKWSELQQCFAKISKDSKMIKTDKGEIITDMDYFFDILLSWFTPFFALKRPPRGPGRSYRFPAPFDALPCLSHAL